MGTKPSNNFQSDRPESGGADRNSERENSGLLERNKQKYAADHAHTEHDESPSSRPGETRANDAGEGSLDGEGER